MRPISLGNFHCLIAKKEMRKILQEISAVVVDVYGWEKNSLWFDCCAWLVRLDICGALIESSMQNYAFCKYTLVNLLVIKR